MTVVADRRKPPSGSFDADAQAFITAREAAAGAALSAAVKTLINDYFVGLKTEGIYSLLTYLAIFQSAVNLSTALVPAVGPAPTSTGFIASDLSAKNGLTGRGSTGGAATTFLLTGFNANTLNQNSNFMYFNGTGFATTGNAFSVVGGIFAGVPTHLWDIIPAGGGLRYFRTYGTASITRNTGFTSSGSLSIDRSASNLATAYQDGVDVGTSTAASAAFPASPIAIFARRQINNGATEFQFLGTLGVAAFGASMTAAQHLALHNLTQALRLGMMAAIP
jgi:hypothetical protein